MVWLYYFVSLSKRESAGILRMDAIAYISLPCTGMDWFCGFIDIEFKSSSSEHSESFYEFSIKAHSCDVH